MKTLPIVTAAACLIVTVAGAASDWRPVVEIEEDVYSYEPADNGAGPMWCHGSTCLVRVGNDVFASGLETLAQAKPLNNCRWTLWQRGAEGWTKLLVDPEGRTREPCPLVVYERGPLFLSVNPTLVQDPTVYSGPARPEILQFSVKSPGGVEETLLPQWKGQPKFTEHSYRSFAADGIRRELILFQNVGYTHAEWAFYDRKGNWSAQGQLNWPWGAGYAKPEPIRICYPNVALSKKAVHFCGVSDIMEPNPEWREFKHKLTGQKWDYDFRRLFYTWTPDITKSAFRPWVEIASREATCGWVTPGDLWIGPDESVHILWSERALDERLREKFFPNEKQRHALEYAVVREGKVVRRQTLLAAEEGGRNERPGRGRFQVTPEGRLLVFFYVSGTDAKGHHLSENRVIEIKTNGTVGPAVKVPLQKPFTDFFTATVRAGSAPSRYLDLLGQREGSGHTMSYARIRLE